MNKFSMKKLLSILLCIALIAALALSTVGCSKNDKTEPVASAETSGGTVSMGEGETMFLFNVVDPEGKESHFEIHTDEKTVGAALLSLGLIAGEDSDYGLYVKTVNGETADYDTDGTYWGFYINGEYAMTGVDATTLEAGATYAFRVEKVEG